MGHSLVEKEAKRLINYIRRHIDVFSLVNYASTLGYRVVFFNSPLGDKLITAYNLGCAAESTPAFTISGYDNVIFIDGKVHYHDQIYLLLHEIGHIVLGHIGDGDISLRDKSYMEAEADAFVYEVMNPRKCHKSLTITILLVIISLSFCSGFLLQQLLVA